MLRGLGNRRKRRAWMLYNNLISSGVDYFTNSLKDTKGSIVYKNAGGFLKRQLRSKVKGNEKSILKGIDFDQISYEWKFRILWGQIPRTGRGTNRPNHVEIKWGGWNNITRIRTRGTQPRMCRGLVRKEKKRPKSHG